MCNKNLNEGLRYNLEIVYKIIKELVDKTLVVEEQKPAEWKPTEEQFNYLAKAIMTLGEEGDCKTAGVLSEIRNGLKCSFPDWKVSPDYPEEGCNVSLNGEVKKIQEWSEDFDKEVESVHKRYPEVSFAKLTRIAHHFAKWADKYKSTEWSEEDKYLLGDAITAADLLGNGNEFKKSNPHLAEAFRKAKEWLKDLPSRFNLQPKQE